MASDYYRVTDWRTRAESLGHSVGLVIAAFALGFVLSGISALGLRTAGVVAPGAQTLPPVALVVLFAAQFFGFGLAVVAYLEWRDEYGLFGIGLPGLADLAWMMGGFIALFASALGVSALVQALEAETATNQVVELGQQDPTLFLYLIPVTIFFVAPAEELLFRGVVQGLLRRAYGIVPGVLLASLLFGVGHWLALTGGGKLTYVAVAGVLGLVLGTVYELSENLLVPITIHGVWNAFLFASQYLAASGAIQPP